MQFDPGLEYKPNRGETSGGAVTSVASAVPGIVPAPVSSTAVANASQLPNPMNSSIAGKDDPSWLLLCRALTEGPYSYI